MLYDYILENYEKDEPIFLEELPGRSKDSIRQEMKHLTDEGKLERLYNGVYYISYVSILGTKGKVSIEKYVDKKFLNVKGLVSGYLTGLHLANMYGFTTQNSACLEVCSNEATTKQRKINIDGRIIIIYKPLVVITEENKTALQFLDFMSTIDKYNELEEEEYKEKLKRFVKAMNVDYTVVKEYISVFPDCDERNIYQGGLMNKKKKKTII